MCHHRHNNIEHTDTVNGIENGKGKQRNINRGSSDGERKTNQQC